MNFRAALVLVFGVLAVGTGAVLLELTEAPALVKAAWRVTLAALIIWPFAIRRAGQEIRELRPADRKRALLAGIALAAHFGLWVPSLDYTSVASSVILVTTNPIFVGLLSPFFLGERVGRRLAIGTWIAFAGAVFIVLGDGSLGQGSEHASNPVLGDLLALGGAFAAALYFMIGRSLRQQISLLAYVATVYSTAAICLIGICLLAGLPLLAYPTETWIFFLALALVPQLLGHSSLNWALEHLSAAYVSAAVLGEPIVSTVLAWWILKQVPPSSALIGGGFILCGLGIATLGEERERRRKKRAARRA